MTFNKNRHEFSHLSKAFTLVELLIVVSVIALLASMVFSSLRGAREGADLSRRKRDAATSNRLLVCGQGQMMDLDENLYNTVEIGGICWMAENLKYLPEVSPSSQGSTSAPHYYVYDYQGTDVSEAKDTTYFEKYGVLYNWPAATEACPPGTRLPTDEEWHILESALATGPCDPKRDWDWQCYPAGTKLSVSDPVFPFWGGDNSSEFAALPAGDRGVDGLFNSLGGGTSFWTSLQHNNDQSWRRLLFTGNETVFRNVNDKDYGFSVRCVR